MKKQVFYKWMFIVPFVLFSMGGMVIAEEKAPPRPIHIQSNTLEAFNEQKLVVFSGNAVAVSGDIVLKSDRILVYYTSGEGSADSNGEVTKIEAEGHVTIHQGERIATGEHAVYERSTQRMILTGNAQLKEGKNLVRGDKITWIINEKRGVVEGYDNRRVTATIYPTEREGKEKKK